MDEHRCLDCPYMVENSIGDFCDIMKRPTWAVKFCPKDYNSEEEIKQAERGD